MNQFKNPLEWAIHSLFIESLGREPRRSLEGSLDKQVVWSFKKSFYGSFGQSLRELLGSSLEGTYDVSRASSIQWGMQSKIKEEFSHDE